MIRPRLIITSSRETIRLMLLTSRQELLRAALPSRVTTHPRAAPTRLEELSPCLQRPLSVVPCAGAEGTSSALSRCDGFGFGAQPAHYEVEVVDPSRWQRGLGAFPDLQQRHLRGVR